MKPNHIELWLNPVSVMPRALAGAQEIVVDLLRSEPPRTVLMEVHDRRHGGSLVVTCIDDLFSFRDQALELTSTPGHPLVHRQGEIADAWRLNDRSTRDLLKYAYDRDLQLTRELVERIDDSESRAKVIFVTSAGSVQYFAHDRVTQSIWAVKSRFTGRFLQNLPVPTPLKRSLRSDALGAFASQQPVMTYVSGLRRIIPKEKSRTDSYSRITVPLRSNANTNEIPMLVLLAIN